MDEVYKINSYAIQGFMPDLTIHLDLPAEVGLGRARDRAELDRMELDRMELEAVEFHQKVAEGYRTLAKLAPERIKTIDATGSIEEIHSKIVEYVDKVLIQ